MAALKLQASNLRARLGLSRECAAVLAALIYGEGRE